MKGVEDLSQCPRPRRGGTPRGPAQPRPPNKKSAGPRSEGAKRTSGGGGPGPRNQEARRRHCGGAARSAKRAGARAGGATTSLPTSTASTAYSSRAIHQTQPLGARGPEPPMPCRDTIQARTCPQDTLCTPGSFLPYPSSPHIPAFGSRGPPRGTASKAL